MVIARPLVTGESSRCLTAPVVGPRNPTRMVADVQRERRHMRALLSLESFHAMERLWACPLMAFSAAEPACRYRLRSQDEITASLGNPDIPLLHRCWAGSSRRINCPTFLNRQAMVGPCHTPECWPLPRGNGLHCIRCDGPSQLCAGHRWACVDMQLCTDCLHEDRPTKLMEVSGHLVTTSYGVVLELKSVNPVSGEVTPDC